MKASQLKLTGLCLFLGLIPLYHLPVEEWIVGPEAQWKPLNYVALLLAGIWLVFFPPLRVSKVRMMVFGAVMAVVSVNMVFAPYANPKWLINQLGFIACVFVISSLYGGADESQVLRLKRFLTILGNSIFVILVLATIYLAVSYRDLLFRAAREGRWNLLIYQLVPLLMWNKQPLGFLALFVFAIFFVFNRRRVLLFLLTCFPLLAAIRNFWLTVFLASFVVAIRRRLSLLLVAPFACAIVVLYYSSSFLTGFWTIKHRLAAYLNTYHIVKTFPFGVGLGGYHTYVLGHQRGLVATYGNLAYADFTAAPESDIAVIFGSLGIGLGLVFYAINGVIAIRLWRDYHRMGDVDRFFSFLFFVTLLSGIAQDQVFSLTYWIVFGFALGTATSQRCAVARLQSCMSTGAGNVRTQLLVRSRRLLTS